MLKDGVRGSLFRSGRERSSGRPFSRGVCDPCILLHVRYPLSCRNRGLVEARLWGRW